MFLAVRRTWGAAVGDAAPAGGSVTQGRRHLRPSYHQATRAILATITGGGVVDPDGNSPRVEEEAKEEDDEKENEWDGVAAVGIEERLPLLRSQIAGKLESIRQRVAAAAARRRQLTGRRRKVAVEVEEEGTLCLWGRRRIGS